MKHRKVLVIIISMVSLVFASCSDESDENEVFPSTIELVAPLSGHLTESVLLTVKAFDEQGGPASQSRCSMQLAVSAGTVKPDRVFLEGAETKVHITLSEPGYLTVTGSIETPFTDSTSLFMDSGLFPDNRLAVLVTEDVWQMMPETIGQYLAETHLKGHNIELFLVTHQSTPQELKEILRSIGEGLEGAFFVGEMQTAWFSWEGEEFPVDLYFMDFDGTWSDANGDGMFENHTGAVGPEIYLGRIQGDIQLLKHYFEKVHRYTISELTLPARNVAFVDDDWTFWHYHQDYYYGLDSIFGRPATDLVFDSMETVSPNYQQMLQEGSTIMQIMAHSSFTESHFSMAPSQCTVYSHAYISSTVPQNVGFRLITSTPFKFFLNGELIDMSAAEGGLGSNGKDYVLNIPAGISQLLIKEARGTFYSYYDEQFYSGLTMFDAGNTDFESLQYQAAAPDGQDYVGGYIDSWYIAGPFTQSDVGWWDLLKYDFLGGEAELDPHAGGIWTDYQSKIHSFNARSALGNLPNESVVYAAVKIFSPNTVDAILSVGYKNNGVRLWLNGQLQVDSNNYDYEGEGYILDRSQIPITLNQGYNRILIKLRNWWDNECGCGLRFLDSSLQPLQGLTSEPAGGQNQEMVIADWLVIGPYVETDATTRLECDFLGEESTILPYEGKPQGDRQWKRVSSLSEILSFNNASVLGLDGGIFRYDQIANINPKVLFYNQFNCSGARYVEEPCLGICYLLDNDYGLISVGSTKTGSMLEFEDFYLPLAEGKSFGPAYKEWFHKVGVYDKAWHYGMTLLGDPTLTIDLTSTTAHGNSTISDPVYSPQEYEILKNTLWNKLKQQRYASPGPPELTYEKYLQKWQE